MMTENRRLALSTLSVLLRYPDDRLLGFARSGDDRETMKLFCPEAAAFAECLARAGLPPLQEDYVRTFDLDAQCSLHMAWHIYGDSPCLGRALAALLELYGDAGFVPRSGQTPDYLPTMLDFLAQAPEWAAPILSETFAPVAAKVAENGERRESLYAPLLRAAASLMAEGVPATATPQEIRA